MSDKLLELLLVQIAETTNSERKNSLLIQIGWCDDDDEACGYTFASIRFTW